ncbi:MAG: hypothetical protein IJS56_03865 [Bacilli bacterium]|nr:hypothetical protein [Bacilli bacterium]
MEFDNLTKKLYKENINWIYSIIKDLDAKGIENKEKFTKDPYQLNNMIVLGYYFMNLHIISNYEEIDADSKSKILTSVINGASSYNQSELSRIYKQPLDLNRIVDDYNSIVRKTKLYSKEDATKARIVAIDEVYRRIYDVVNKKHLMVFTRVFMASFHEYESRLDAIIEKYLKEEK